MGVGSPDDLVEGVARGIDMFDCVLPTRIGRHGAFFTPYGKINIKKEIFKNDFSPLNENCQCLACQNFTRAYLRHLYIEKEILAMRMLSIHNLYFFINLMKKIQTSILENRFNEFRKDFWEDWK